MADDDAARGQHLLDHAQAEREAKIEPDGVADDLRRVSIAGVNWVSRRRHPARLPDQLGSTKPALGQLDGAAPAILTKSSGKFHQFCNPLSGPYRGRPVILLKRHKADPSGGTLPMALWGLGG